MNRPDATALEHAVEGADNLRVDSDPTAEGPEANWLFYALGDLWHVRDELMRLRARYTRGDQQALAHTAPVVLADAIENLQAIADRVHQRLTHVQGEANKPR